MKKTKKGYMCEIDWTWELGESMGGTKVYSSLKDLKADHKSWEECGIVEVEVKLTKIVVQSNRGESL